YSHREKAQAARQRVIEELTEFRVDSSDERLASLKDAIENWHLVVEASSKASTSSPTKQNLS
ncbi:MAG: hypothetical protein B7Y08_24495, partial [Rhodospirillales bacterium 24-66-33]